MQFSVITLFLALGIWVQATSTMFTCNGSNFGGCCTRFLENGNGVGCVFATVQTGGREAQYSCASKDDGEACCHTIPHVGHSIPLPCVKVN
ncbi:hypothetical protein BGZ60DRAFT_420657 [Tricladium varicosporioides]|nr:hypothetical protein BGZ60DRAFT_420657 [Hymenoscyphus varicosporioides]